jgi:hypothetical protein
MKEVNEQMKMRAGLYSRFWVGVTVVLSIVVILCGFPAFTKKFGLPASLLWTFAAVLGVWATYFVRARMFSGRSPSNKTQESGPRRGPGR